MDKDKIAELLKDALVEVEGGEKNSVDRLAEAVERLAKAIESRPYYWYYPHYPYTITYPSSSVTYGTTTSGCYSNTGTCECNE